MSGIEEILCLVDTTAFFLEASCIWLGTSVLVVASFVIVVVVVVDCFCRICVWML